MMHDDDSSASSDMFSPTAGRRASLHENTPEHQQPNNNNNNNNDDTLPALQDNSWIGARVSPIPSFDNDEDVDDLLATAPYRRALHDSLEAGTNHHHYRFFASERTALLGNNNNNKQHGKGTHNNKQQLLSQIHPLWNLQDNDDNIPTKGGGRTHRLSSRHDFWQYGVVSVSGLWLGMMGLHDLYLAYIALRRGIAPLYSVGWLSSTPPFLGPSARTLSRFGAFIPSMVISKRQFWRFGSSLFISSSLIEFMIILWAWSFLRRAGIVPSVLLIYLLAAVTGQLWMLAFNPHGISGAVSFGTCGVLCTVGMQKPQLRFKLFMTAIVIVMVGILSPSSSSPGSIGGSFMGWALSGFSMAFRSNQIVWQSLSTISALILLIIPIVYYFVWGTAFTASNY